MVVYKSIFDPTYWNHSGPSFESHLLNLIIRSPAEEVQNPSWPRVVTPDIAALESVTPSVSNMVVDVEDTTMVTLITPSTTQNPGGSDLSFLS